MGKLTKEEAKKSWDEFTYETLPILQTVAFAEVTGGNHILELVPIENKNGAIVGSKYEIMPWEETERLVNALNWLYQNMDKVHDIGEPYFLLSQRASKHNFFESLLSRGIGKPVEEVKVDHHVTHLSNHAKEAQEELKLRKKSDNVKSPFSVF